MPIQTGAQVPFLIITYAAIGAVLHVCVICESASTMYVVHIWIIEKPQDDTGNVYMYMYNMNSECV